VWEERDGGGGGIPRRVSDLWATGRRPTAAQHFSTRRFTTSVNVPAKDLERTDSNGGSQAGVVVRLWTCRVVGGIGLPLAGRRRHSWLLSQPRWGRTERDFLSANLLVGPDYSSPGLRSVAPTPGSFGFFSLGA